MKSNLKAGMRTLQHLRKLGYRAAVCEQSIAHVEGKRQKNIFAGRFTRDLFGFMDILAFGGGVPGAIAVQTTSRKQMSAHMRAYRRTPKISSAILDWLAAGNQFVLHGWQLVEVPNKTRPGTKGRWKLTEHNITASDLVPNTQDIAAMEKTA